MISFAACRAHMAFVCMFVCVCLCREWCSARPSARSRRWWALAQACRCWRIGPFFLLRCASASLWPATAAPCGSPAVRAAQRRAPAAAERSCATISACRRGSACCGLRSIDQRALPVHRSARGPSACTSSAVGRGGARAHAHRRDRVGCARSLQPRARRVQRTPPDLHTGRSRSFRCSACRASSRTPAMCAARPPRRLSGASACSAVGPPVRPWRPRSAHAWLSARRQPRGEAASRAFRLRRRSRCMLRCAAAGRRRAALASPARAAAAR